MLVRPAAPVAPDAAVAEVIAIRNAITYTLREAGHEVMRLREHLPIEPPDAAVHAKATKLLNRLMLTGSIIEASYWWSQCVEFGYGNNSGANLTPKLTYCRKPQPSAATHRL
jgi:hypothetical protein